MGLRELGRFRSLAAFLGALAIAGLGISQAKAQPSSSPPGAHAPVPPAPKERIAAIKKTFADSQVLLHKYEWIETTVVSLKGEEKSRTQNRCYYGAEGKIEKIPLEPTPEEKPGRGLRGRIKEQRKEELADYMKSAAGLVHKYIPPDHERIQKCTDAGTTSIHILDPDKRASVEFDDYLQPGDSLSVEIDLTNNRILGVKVATALGDDKDPVALEVKFDQFPDGTIYTAQTKLEAKAKSVTVTVDNSGYRLLGP